MRGDPPILAETQSPKTEVRQGLPILGFQRGILFLENSLSPLPPWEVSQKSREAQGKGLSGDGIKGERKNNS